MTGKTRRLFISLIALIVVIAALVLVRLREKPAEIPVTPEVTAPEILSDFAVTDLRSVTVSRKANGSDLKLRFFSSDGENWMIADTTENFRPMKDHLVSDIRALSKLQSRTIITEDAEDNQLDEFGLNPPEALLIFKDREGKSRTVEIGMANPSGSGRYCRLSGSGKVILIPSYSLNAVFNSAEDYRDMSLPSVSLDKMSYFEYRYKGRTFRISPREGEDHYTAMVSPFTVTSPWKSEYPLNDQVFQKAINEETPLPGNVRGFLDDADPLNEKLGLDEETADLLNFGDTDGKSLNLIIGNEDGQGNRFVRFGDHTDSVFLLKDSDLAIIKTDPFNFTGRFVFLGSIFQIAQVKVEKGGETWLMRRMERGKPEDTDDDRFIVNTLEVPKKEYTSVYQKFISIMYEGVALDGPSLKSPEIRITISNINPKIEPKIIRYWPYDKTYYQVSIDNRPIEFLVGQYQLVDFIEDLSALAEYGS